MSVQDNVELVRSITEKDLNTGDVSYVEEVFSPDYVVHVRGFDLPRGPDAFTAAVSFWRQPQAQSRPAEATVGRQ